MHFLSPLYLIIFIYRIPYYDFHGGVVGFTPEQYLKVNGFSNLYFGWGSEDDDLGIRFTPLAPIIPFDTPS